MVSVSQPMSASYTPSRGMQPLSANIFTLGGNFLSSIGVGIIQDMNPRQRAFAHNYVNNGGDAKSAAIEAGYTKQYAHTHSSMTILKNPDVIAEIKRMRNSVNKMVDKNATDVVNQFSKIAFSDRVGFLKPDPLREGEFMYKSPDELTDEQRDVIENTKLYTAEIVMVGQDGKPQSTFRQEYTYVFSDKAKALEQMGRHFGIFDDKLKLGVAQSNPFTDATPEQLEKLKKVIVNTMRIPNTIEGRVEVKNGK